VDLFALFRSAPRNAEAPPAPRIPPGMYGRVFVSPCREAGWGCGHIAAAAPSLPLVGRVAPSGARGRVGVITPPSLAFGESALPIKGREGTELHAKAR